MNLQPLNQTKLVQWLSNKFFYIATCLYILSTLATMRSLLGPFSMQTWLAPDAFWIHPSAFLGIMAAITILHAAWKEDNQSVWIQLIILAVLIVAGPVLYPLAYLHSWLILFGIAWTVLMAVMNSVAQGETFS